MRMYGEDFYPVTYRRAQPTSSLQARYTGFNPGTKVLRSGTIRREGARALTCDIIFERDVAVTLRDGAVVDTDVFQPAKNETVPAIVAWTPYGKEVGSQSLDDMGPARGGVPLSEVSELQKFEGADPAYYVAQGYVILNPDARGAFGSDRNITSWGRQLAEDGYDYVEWLAAQLWSSGKVALSGNSWLAISQWFIAAEQPPHLTAIVPWEGLVDLYRSVTNRGGIAPPDFEEGIVESFARDYFIEDAARMVTGNELINLY